MIRILLILTLLNFTLPCLAAEPATDQSQSPTFDELKNHPGVKVSKDGQTLEFPGGVSFSRKGFPGNDHSGKGAILCTRAIYLSLKKSLEDCPVVNVVKRNIEEAYFWFSLVPDSDPNHHLAINTRDWIAKELSPEQINALKKRVQDWKPTSKGTTDLSAIGNHLTAEERAARGDAKAQFELGALHDYQQDSVEAEKWYRKAAEQGNGVAQYSLGRLYANGGGNVSDEEFEKMLESAITKIDDFIVINSLTPITKAQLEEQEKKLKLPYGCTGNESARGMINQFESMPSGKFESLVKDSLSVPRPPVMNPCL